MTKPIVAIVGRPNVGKSTLFNRLLGERKAIVDNLPHVTRDRNYAECSWLDHAFILVDTGGFTDERDRLLKAALQQCLAAVEEAEAIIFLVDGRTGLQPGDFDLADFLRKAGKPVVLAVNKAEKDLSVEEFYRLGMGEPLPVSAEHGLNIGDLLDRVTAHFNKRQAAEETAGDILKIAIVGRPNVGKSSLLNAILGEERVIVSDTPGTTRDAIDTHLTHQGRRYLFVDTAGIRRRSKVDTGVEHYGVVRALRAIDRSHLALMVMDGVEPFSEQDQRIAGYVHEAGKAQILVLNKGDLAESLPEGGPDQALRAAMAFLDYVPVVRISAKTGYNVHKLWEMIDFVGSQYRKRIPTSKLNEAIQEAVLRHEPPSFHGRKLHVYHAVQSQTAPPVILLYVNQTNLLHFSYERYLENKIRGAFGFQGSPLRIVLRASK
ncbi:MAG: ribosome biogenesis GTPase Der [Bacillota bacterium]